MLKGLIESKQLSIYQHVNVKNSISLGKSLQLPCKKNEKIKVCCASKGTLKMNLTLEMRERQDGFHQQSRHLQAAGGQYPFQHTFFFFYFLQEHLLFHSHGSNFRPPSPPAFGYTSSLSTQSSPTTSSSFLPGFLIPLNQKN